MNNIKLLPQNLINKIAAGEVLERPASAVKELIENSIDAKSTKINVSIRNGGKTEIRVSDNGEGIKSSELELAIKRHATSKLNDHSLSSIKTLGFRGEALPSIASVSKMKIVTKSIYDQHGNELLINAGIIGGKKPTARESGTTIEVRDLFFSTPARLKFLKTENYEALLIKKMIQKLALSNPNIEFNFYSNDKNVLSTFQYNEKSHEKVLNNRITELFGEKFLENLISFDQKREDYRFSGMIGLPTFNHSNSTNQHVFVNKRSISDKLINGAIKAAYRDFLSYDRFPQVIIFIDSPYSEVDINVHPTKSEVRFRDSNFLRSNLISSIKEGLKSAGHSSSSLNTFRALDKMKTENQIINFKRDTSKQERISVKLENHNSQNIEKNKTENYPLGFAKSQYHDTYIISQTDQGIVIIDQHAAHERLVYEKLKNNFYDKKIETQVLLIPEIIEIDSAMLELTLNFKKVLQNYGLFIEPFSKDSILIREVPFILSKSNIKKMFKDVVNELSEIGDSDILETHINRICSSMACHGSIRAGREMYQEEMNNLLREMESTPYSGQCNHGRPTYIKLDLADIEKLFGRK